MAPFNLLAGGVECGVVPHQGHFQQTKRCSEEDRTAALRKQRYDVSSTQVGLQHFEKGGSVNKCTHI